MRATIFVPTVAYSYRTIGIIISSVIAVGCIVVAVLISGPLPFRLFGTANAISTRDLLVQYAAKDTDADGLPDWEEALYGTDPNNAHSVRADVLDGEAVQQGLVKPKFASATSTPVDVNSLPGTTANSNTLTDQFAREFFASYLQKSTVGTPSAEAVATFVENKVDTLTKQGVLATFNQTQIRIAGSGEDALRAYARAVDVATQPYSANASKGELEYYFDALSKDDAAALAKVRAIATSYTLSAGAYMKVPVPAEAAATHLALANALADTGRALTDMTAFSTDPLQAMVGVGRYPAAAQRVLNGMAALHAVYVSAGVSIEAGEPGYDFYHSLEAVVPLDKPTSP